MTDKEEFLMPYYQKFAFDIVAFAVEQYKSALVNVDRHEVKKNELEDLLNKAYKDGDDSTTISKLEKQLTNATNYYNNDTRLIRECETFFNSTWCKILCQDAMEPTKIPRIIKERIANGEINSRGAMVSSA